MSSRLDRSQTGRTQRLKQKAVAAFYNANPVTATKNLDSSTRLLLQGGNSSIYTVDNMGINTYDPGCGGCERLPNTLYDYSVSPGSPFDISGQGHDVAYANGLWVAVGFNVNGNNILWSTDPTKGWTPSPGKPFEIDGFVNGIAYGNGLWVAVGKNENGNNILWSTDPTTGWTESPGNQFDSDFGGSGIAYGNGIWVAVGNDGGGQNIVWSTNPTISWSPAETSFNYVGNGVAYANGLWVACGEDSDGNNILYTNDPRSTWTPSPGKPFGFGLLSGDRGFGTNIAFANGLWIATGQSDTEGILNGKNILYTRDPKMGWNVSPGEPFGSGTNGGNKFNSTGIANGIAAGSGNWVAVGIDSNDPPIYNLLYSTDPTTEWKKQGTSQTILYNIATDGIGNWVAVGYDEISNNHIVCFKLTNKRTLL